MPIAENAAESISGESPRMIGLIPALLKYNNVTSAAGVHWRDLSQKKSASNAPLIASGKAIRNFLEKKIGSSFHNVQSNAAIASPNADPITAALRLDKMRSR